MEPSTTADSQQGAQNNEQINSTFTHNEPSTNQTSHAQSKEQLNSTFTLIESESNPEDGAQNEEQLNSQCGSHTTQKDDSKKAKQLISTQSEASENNETMPTCSNNLQHNERRDDKIKNKDTISGSQPVQESANDKISTVNVNIDKSVELNKAHEVQSTRNSGDRGASKSNISATDTCVAPEEHPPMNTDTNESYTSVTNGSCSKSGESSSERNGAQEGQPINDVTSVTSTCVKSGAKVNVSANERSGVQEGQSTTRNDPIKTSSSVASTSANEAQEGQSLHNDTSSASTSCVIKSGDSTCDVFQSTDWREQEYATQFFGFTPKSLSDGVYNAMLDYTWQYFKAAANYAEGEFPRYVEKSDIAKANNFFLRKVTKVLEKAFDKLENYLLSNLMRIPAGVVLPEDQIHLQQHLQLSKTELQLLDDDIQTLKTKIINAKYMNSYMKAEIQRLEKAQEIHDQFAAFQTKIRKIFANAGVPDVGESFKFVGEKVKKIKTLLDRLEDSQGEQLEQNDLPNKKRKQSGTDELNQSKRVKTL